MREDRRAVVVAGGVGQLAAVVAEVLPVVALPVTLALLLVAAELSGRADERQARRLRGVATGLALVAVGLALPRVLSPGAGGLREVLGPLLVAVQVAHAATWRTHRELQGGLGIAVGLLVLGASYAPDVLVGLPLLAGWVACVHAHLRLQQSRLTDVPQVAGPARPSTLAATALAVVVGLVAFLLLPQPSEAAAARLGSSKAGAASSARAAGLSGDEVDLRARGDLSDRVLAEVVEPSELGLWRSSAYSSWDGARWSAPETQPQLLAGPPFRLPDAPTGRTRTDRVDLRQGGGVVWSPGLPVSVRPAGGGAALDRSGAVRLPSRTRTYDVTSVPLTQDVAALRAGAADARWLQLPAGLPDRVRVLAEQVTAGQASTAGKVRAVEQWLAANARYQLDSPVPGPGEDAVDRFLFVDRVGFCEQFAAAETVLLRAVGIPSRFVVGLAYGEPSGGGRRLFREKNLHAWVEVSYAGEVWASSDPTAGAAQVQATASLRARLATLVLRGLRALDGVPGGRPALVLLLLGGVAAAALARGLPHRARHVEDMADAAPAGRPALASFLRWDATLGPAARRSGESLPEMRRRLALPATQAQALSVVEQECYALDPPDEERAGSVETALTAPSVT